MLKDLHTFDVIIDYLCKSEELYNIFLILCYSS